MSPSERTEAEDRARERPDTDDQTPGERERGQPTEGKQPWADEPEPGETPAKLTPKQRLGVALAFVALGGLGAAVANLVFGYTVRNSLFVAAAIFVFLGWSFVRDSSRI